MMRTRAFYAAMALLALCSGSPLAADEFGSECGLASSNVDINSLGACLSRSFTQSKIDYTLDKNIKLTTYSKSTLSMKIQWNIEDSLYYSDLVLYFDNKITKQAELHKKKAQELWCRVQKTSEFIKLGGKIRMAFYRYANRELANWPVIEFVIDDCPAENAP